MPDPTPGTTQPVQQSTESAQQPQQQPNEQGTVGAPTQAPSQNQEGQQATTQSTEGTQEQPTTQQTPQQISREEAQKRINRMYARLQEERKKRFAAEAQAAVTPKPTTQPTREEDEDGEPTPTPSLTKQDVEAIVESKEREKRFVDSEMRVFEQHPDALNEDGTFNMSSTFVQKYIEIGRRNPMLAAMENGPEMAAAMADKELGADFTRGRVHEAQRQQQSINNFTTRSTTSVPPNVPEVQLTDTQKKIAKRMGMTEQEYINSQKSSKVQQKSWEVKP